MSGRKHTRIGDGESAITAEERTGRSSNPTTTPSWSPISRPRSSLTSIRGRVNRWYTPEANSYSIHPEDIHPDDIDRGREECVSQVTGKDVDAQLIAYFGASTSHGSFVGVVLMFLGLNGIRVAAAGPFGLYPSHTVLLASVVAALPVVLGAPGVSIFGPPPAIAPEDSSSWRFSSPWSSV